MQEIWKVYKETYNERWGEVMWEVSNYGNVKMNGKPYECNLTGRYKMFAGVYLHRVVAELFIPNTENKPEVDHIDTNTLNNNVNNLRWSTHKDNSNNILTRQKMSENHADFTGEKAPRAIKCVYNGIEFGCIKDAYDYAVKHCGYDKSYVPFYRYIKQQNNL